MKIQIINGPNLNLLGMREPDLYGTESFPAIFEKLQRAYPEIELDYYQSNVEGRSSTRFMKRDLTPPGLFSMQAGTPIHRSRSAMRSRR